MILTKELIEAGKTSKGAYTKKQVEALGLKWSDLKSGWLTKLIGKEITEQTYQTFMEDAGRFISQRSEKKLKKEAIQKEQEKHEEPLVLILLNEIKENRYMIETLVNEVEELKNKLI